VIIPLLIAGIAYTRVAFFLGILYIIGREIYSQGYRRSGAKGRMIGALTLDLALLVLWSMALYSCFYWGNGLSGLKRLIF
jgi:glutathione S-transferase